MITIKDLWKQFRSDFKKISPSPESDFRWLLESVTGQSYCGPMVIDSEKELSTEHLEKVLKLMKRRATGEPVAYILGEWDFYGRTFKVGPGVLVPRPETEMIIDLFKRYFQPDQSLKIADLGAGSGCLAITLALESPRSQVTAVEFSKQAFVFLDKNSQLYSLQNHPRFHVEQQDAQVWCEHQLEESFDLIVSNPPYIHEGDKRVDPQVRRFEPYSALFSPDNGLQHFRLWTEQAARLLNAGGILLCELGEGQKSVAVSHMTSMSVFGTVEVEPDLNGIPRTLVAIKN